MGSSDDSSATKKLLIFDGKVENFIVWRERFKVYLLCKGIRVISDEVDENKREAMQTQLYAEIIMHLNNNLLQTIISVGESNGFKVWEYLVETYGTIKTCQIVFLWKEFVDMTKSSSETVVQFISRYELIIYKLQSAKETLSDNLKIAILLKALPEEYESFVSALQFQAIDYKTLKAKLVEKSISMETLSLCDETESSGVAAKAYYNPRGQAIKGSNYAVKCSNCGKPHKLERCWAPGGPLHKPRAKSPDDIAISGLALNVTERDDIFLILDSGCTKHILNQKSFFNKLLSTNGSKTVESGDGSKQCVEGHGQANISVCDLNGQKSCLQLEDALFVPGFKFNLISIDILCMKKNSVRFTESTGTLILSTGHEFELIRRNGLYCLQILSDFCLLSLQQWHHRLGHADQSMIKKLPDVVDGVDFHKASCTISKCDLCAINKISKVAVSKDPVLKSEHVLDIVFTDVCGPLVESTQGNRYIISFIDDHSRYAKVYFMKRKSESLDKFKLFVAEFGLPKALRSDNAKEYFTKQMTEFLVEKHVGMQQQSSAPYSPHQNGVAERYWRTINDMARTMLNHASLPASFWVRAVETAVYLRNRLLTAAVAGKTPYEMLYKKKPNLKNTRIFGSDCVVKIERHRTKMEQKGKRGIFMGYDEHSPAYVVYLCDENKFTKSRNVSIFEQTFNYIGSQRTTMESSCLHLLPIVNADPIVEGAAVAAPETVADIDVIDIDTSDTHEESDDVEDEITNSFHNINETNSQAIPVRRSNRVVKKPIWQTDYEMNDTFSDESELAGIALKTTVFSDVPNTYQQAISSPESIQWNAAIVKEYNSLLDNKTWDLVPRPSHCTVIKGRWVFAKKMNSIGIVETFKARYVAKGFSQIQGENYDETFAPTAKMTTIRALIAIAAQENLLLHQIDVKTAFLNSPLDDEIYVEQPVGYAQGDLVCKLNKCIYGLKQASRLWNKYLDNILCMFGFAQSAADPCLYFFAGEHTYLLVWVDDIIIISYNDSRINEIIVYFSSKVTIDDRGVLTWFLGMSVEIGVDCITLNQKQYIVDVLERWGMTDSKPANTPMVSNDIVTDESINLDLIGPYRKLIGNLIYLSTISRPDIAYAVNFLSRYCTKPNQTLFVAAKRILRYLRGSMDFKLIFRRSNFALTAYCDADWAGDLSDRKSTSGILIKCNPNDSPIQWRTIRQQSVALSSCEAEYMALAACIQEMLYVKFVFFTIGYKSDSVKCPLVYSDNQGCIALAKNPLMNRRSKHIDIKYHFLRDIVAKGEVELAYLCTDRMPADVLTKPLAREKLDYLVSLLYGSKGRVNMHYNV